MLGADSFSKNSSISVIRLIDIKLDLCVSYGKVGEGLSRGDISDSVSVRLSLSDSSFVMFWIVGEIEFVLI